MSSIVDGVTLVPEQTFFPTGGGVLALATTEQYAALVKVKRRVADDKSAEFVYRGCELGILAKELGVKPSNVDKLADRLFYVGAKAKAYFGSSPSSSPTLPDLQAPTKAAADAIRLALEQALGHPVNAGTAHVAETLKVYSKEFIDYFSNPVDAGSFSATLSTIPSRHASEALFYYYHLRQTLGRWGDGFRSVHISSSKSLQIATQFAKHRNRPAVVLVGWIPRRATLA